MKLIYLQFSKAWKDRPARLASSTQRGGGAIAGSSTRQYHGIHGMLASVTACDAGISNMRSRYCTPSLTDTQRQTEGEQLPAAQCTLQDLFPSLIIFRSNKTAREIRAPDPPETKPSAMYRPFLVVNVRGSVGSDAEAGRQGVQKGCGREKRSTLDCCGGAARDPTRKPCREKYFRAQSVREPTRVQ